MIESLKDLSLSVEQLESLDDDALFLLLEKVKKAKEVEYRERCQKSFMAFVEAMWPEFIHGGHHKLMADAFEEVVDGDTKRLIINLPPRHSKSELTSFLLPAWFLGKYPNKKVIQIGNTAELSVGFGRKVRNLIDSDVYQKVFQGVKLQADSKAAGRWNTNRGGEYFAIGVGGAVTGKGADLLIVDDAHSEQEGASLDPSVFDRTYDWYTSGPRQRLQPGGRIAIVQTRWNKRDLVGRVLKESVEVRGSDEWKLVQLPAILPSGRPLWPEFWSLEELDQLRAELPASKWRAQYQQEPTSEEGAIIKRTYWRRWMEKEPPECSFTIQAWDTAYLKGNRNDYSACTDWGVFTHEDDEGTDRQCIILLNAWKERVEFPSLKAEALSRYRSRQPDSVSIEAKASGWPLIQELRAMGIPVRDYTPARGSQAAPNDKISRINSISDLFASGCVFAPETAFAEMVIEEFADFPSGEHDDLVDSAYLALKRFRDGGFVRLPSDEVREKRNPPRPSSEPYY